MVVGPALLLGLFGVRALVQERAFARRLAEDRLRTALETVARRAELEFASWQQAVDQAGQVGAASPALWPEQIRRALDGSRSAVLLIRSGNGIEAFPPGSLLYSVEPQQRRPASPSASASAAADTIALLHRARGLKKTGRNAEAAAAFEELRGRAPVFIGSLPSDLLARIALLDLPPVRRDAAVELYRDLIGGRWQLAKHSYLFYSERTRAALPPGALAALQPSESRKMALTLAAERFLDNPQRWSAGAVTFWCAEPFAALVVSEPSLTDWFWPAAFGSAPDRDLRFAAMTASGQPLFGAAPAGLHTVERTIHLPGLPMRLVAWPVNPATLYRQGSARQNFYLAMIGGVAALLATGSFLALRTVRAELAVAQMKAGFVSTVSHEFRSPLAGINQLAEMLHDGRVIDDERRRRYYEMIVRETQRLRRLVENVLDFSRMEEGRKQYRMETFDAARWLADLAEDARRELCVPGFELAAALPENLPALHGDREALTTAVRNLIDNAVKYSGGSRLIRLEVRAEAGAVLISVRDYGVGISPRDKPHIFEKFYRGASTAQEVKGAGLGLNLVQHIVKAHGGDVTFESTEGEGSAFTIRLRS